MRIPHTPTGTQGKMLHTHLLGTSVPSAFFLQDLGPGIGALDSPSPTPL